MRGFRDLLQIDRPTEVVDIGANPIDGDPPYKPLLEAGLARITGFEPQPEAYAALIAAPRPNERYLPHAIGDGAEHTLHICRGSGMTSLYRPDTATLDLFEALAPLAEVLERVNLPTRRLDDVDEIERIDFLKIDVQGGELDVFRHGRRKLADAVVVQTEVSFMTLYEDQPPLGAIDLELRDQGFVPHCFAGVKLWPISPCRIGGDPRRPLNQLLEADIVYVRDFAHPDRMSDDQLKHLALIAHHCYASVDLALRCLLLLERRGALPAGSRRAYLGLVAAQRAA
jgi:FkbM family methyltransferase